VLGRLDLAGIFRSFMADPAAARPAAEALAASLPRLLESLEDGRAKRLLGKLLPRIAGGPGGARILARALRALVAGGKHQEVFDLAITQLRSILASKESQLRTAIETRVRAEGGALVGWLAGAAVARRILSTVNGELAKMEPSDSDLRAAFEVWLREEIDRLETDPERAAAVGRALRQAVSHPTVAAWIEDIWARLKAALVADAGNPQGRTVALLESAFANAGTLLEQDPVAREKLNRAVEGLLATVMPAARAQLSGFIAQVVAGWDTRQVTEKIELRVGRDLQYVRMNGTLVGFLVGGALFALLTAAFGPIAF
ncbi:MAG: putative rane-anchored protein YjiN, family, partial [Belnapia sp.]|nr:putative rane-anchored protein YjiN, family [Belnapia sp.]